MAVHHVDVEDHLHVGGLLEARNGLADGGVLGDREHLRAHDPAGGLLRVLEQVLDVGGLAGPHSPEHPLPEFLGEFAQELGGVVGVEFLEELGDLGGLEPRHQVGGPLDPELSERRRGEIQVPLEDDPERLQPVGLRQVGEDLGDIRRMQLLEDAVCVSEGPPGHQFAHRLREQRGLGENHGGYRKGAPRRGRFSGWVPEVGRIRRAASGGAGYHGARSLRRFLGAFAATAHSRAACR